MQRVAGFAREHGYSLHLFAGGYGSVDLHKEVHTGHGDETLLIGITLYRVQDGDDGPRWEAEVSHLPQASMVVVRSLRFSWPHKNFERLFEGPVIKMALLYAASKDI